MREVLAHYPIPLSFMLGVMGALIGSFLNVVIARLPEGKSVVSPPSHCPHCGYQIPPWLNVPILSWLVLRGRCRNCGQPISLRYPVVELLTALLFVAVGQRFGFTLATLAGLILVAGLVAITFIDIDCFLIPDEISVWGTVVGVLIRPLAFDVPWWSGLAGAALGGGFLLIIRWSYQLARNKEGMGLGDIKLIAMIGAFLGSGSLIPVILVASIVGSVYGLIIIAVERIRGDEDEEAEAAEGKPAPEPRFVDENGEPWEPPRYALPFGPFLALGALTVLLFEPTLERWIHLLRV